MYFSSFILKKNTILLKKKTIQKKIIIVEAELNRVNIDDIRNLEDLPRFVFIDEEYRNLRVVNDG